MDERCGGPRQPFPPSAATFLAAEGDVPVFERFEAGVRQGNAGEVRRKGGEELGAGARRLAVGHPVRVPHLGRHESAEVSGGQCRLARAPEESGARADGHAPGIGAGREPLRALGGQGSQGEVFHNCLR